MRIQLPVALKELNDYSLLIVYHVNLRNSNRTTKDTELNKRHGEDTTVVAVILQWDVCFYVDRPYVCVCPPIIVVLHCQPLNLQD